MNNNLRKAITANSEKLSTFHETAEVLSIDGLIESIQQGLEEATQNLGIALSELK